MPLTDEFALTFSLEYQPVSMEDFQFEQFLGEEVWESFSQNNEEFYQFFDRFYFEEHKIGGYAYFTG